MAALLRALRAPFFWGLGDFLGGVASRRISVLTVLAVSQAIGLAGLVVWILLASDPFPGSRAPAGCRGGRRGARRARRALPRPRDRRDGHRGADLRGGAGRAARSRRSHTEPCPSAVQWARHRPRARGNRDALPRAVRRTALAGSPRERASRSSQPSASAPSSSASTSAADESVPWAVGAARSPPVVDCVRGRRRHVRTARATALARPGPRRRRCLRHGRERVRRVRDDRGRRRNRRRS